MIYIIYIQRFASVHLKPKCDLIYINLYNLHLNLLIHLLYSALIRHVGISAIGKQFYYYYYQFRIFSIFPRTEEANPRHSRLSPVSGHAETATIARDSPQGDATSRRRNVLARRAPPGDLLLRLQAARVHDRDIPGLTNVGQRPRNGSDIRRRPLDGNEHAHVDTETLYVTGA